MKMLNKVSYESLENGLGWMHKTKFSDDVCEKQFGAAYEACQKETGPLVDSKK